MNAKLELEMARLHLKTRIKAITLTHNGTSKQQQSFDETYRTELSSSLMPGPFITNI